MAHSQDTLNEQMMNKAKKKHMSVVYMMSMFGTFSCFSSYLPPTIIPKLIIKPVKTFSFVNRVNKIYMYT